MSKQEIDQLINKPPSSSSQDQGTQSIHNLNKQLQDFQNRFKGYHFQKTFSDSDSQQEVRKKPSFNNPPPPTKQQKQDQSRLSQIKDQIKWKDTQIQQLMKLQGDSLKDKKIKELAQKVKLLSINLEKEKNKYKILQCSNMKKKDESANLMKITTLTSNNNDLKKSMKLSDDNDLKNKLAQSQKQVMQMRLKNQNLKNQLNKAMRVISKQIGQDTNIDDILSQQNPWKGRQQKIQHLKGKVKQLQSKLNNNPDMSHISHMSGFTMISSDKTSRQQTTLNNLTDNKRKEMQNLKVQIQAVKSENQILQGKVKSLASRKITLESQIKEMKGEYEKKEKLFKEKSENDDKYIALLKAENEKLKKDKDDKVVTKLVYKNSEANSNQVTELKKQLDKLKNAYMKKEFENKQLTDKMEKQQTKVRQEPRNQVRPLSSDKTKKVIQKKIEQLQKQYMEQENVDQSITPEEEQAIYKQWKEGKLKSGK